MWRRAGTVVRRAGASTIIPVRPLYRRADVQGSSLHDRPESPRRGGFRLGSLDVSDLVARPDGLSGSTGARKGAERSEEHTSELQSLMRTSYAVFCLKKQKIKNSNQTLKTSATN